jgi:hypothetical protein
MQGLSNFGKINIQIIEVLKAAKDKNIDDDSGDMELFPEMPVRSIYFDSDEIIDKYNSTEQKQVFPAERQIKDRTGE